MKKRKPITLVLKEEVVSNQKEETLELPEFTCKQLFERPLPTKVHNNGLEVIHRQGDVANHYHVQNLHWQVVLDSKVEKSNVDKFIYILVIFLWTLVVVFATLLLTFSLDMV